MENMDLRELFSGIYYGKKVLITGHTGFKGSWCAYWLGLMGAEVYGIALEPNTNPSHYNLLKLNMNSHIQDITDSNKIHRIFKNIEPDIVFHFAAQPLVRLSYAEPYSTFNTNIMGTVNVLEASRNLKQPCCSCDNNE
jgi:CDP-glucose 4,6-dehydratase